MKNNKKVKNATEVVSSGIHFKSKTEERFYHTLVLNGFKPSYEPYTFTLWDGFTPVTPFYDQETSKQRDKRDNGGKKTALQLKLKDSKIIGIRYTPDFYFKYKDLDVYIEAKGRENDVFYIKKKMFIKFLDDRLTKDNIKSIFFEVYTKKQLLQAIEIIKSYEETDKNN